MKGLPVRLAISLVIVMLFAALVQNDVLKSKAESLEEYVQFRRNTLWSFSSSSQRSVDKCVENLHPAVKQGDPCQDVDWMEALKGAACMQICQLALAPAALRDSLLLVGMLAYNGALEVINWVVRVGIY